MKVKSDLHVHTTLSACAKPDALPESYIALARENGIATIAFTNHFWDENVPGVIKWYAPQNLSHVMKLREQISKQPDDVRVLFGVETEFIGSLKCGVEGGFAAITPKVAENFDFVLIPPDHFHMKNFTIDASVSEPRDVKVWFISNFIEAAQIKLGVPTGIAHPFMPMGFAAESCKSLLEVISDEEYRHCFTVAAENGKSVEMNRGIVCEPLGDEYVRMMSIARECGCKFHFGSDAHTPSSFSRYDELAAFAQKCGITDADMFAV